MAAKSITFYFDVESPFSYIAFELLERYSNADARDAALLGRLNARLGPGSNIYGKSQ